MTQLLIISIHCQAKISGKAKIKANRESKDEDEKVAEYPVLPLLVCVP